jgi:hypothetical protein
VIVAEEVIVPRLISRRELPADRRAAMYALLVAHFEGVTPEQFAADLEAIRDVIILERGEHLVGFTTLLAYESEYAGEPVSVIYSGDTIVAPEAWHSPVLARAWIAAVNRIRHDFPHGRYYWLLLTSGFRTYRFLPVFWREFFPTHARATPDEAHGLLRHLAQERFGAAFDATAGIVRFPRPQRLRPGLAGVPAGRDADPHVRFFLERNPGYRDGDELVCLAELAATNLTAAGRRMVDRPLS